MLPQVIASLDAIESLILPVLIAHNANGEVHGLTPQAAAMSEPPIPVLRSSCHSGLPFS